jgi:outer membrane protein OmpA-like peptidoglycan-associated protein
VTEESIPSLQELAQQLKAYPSAIFEIVGHINYQSRYDSTHLGDLYQLSTKRAKVVYEYLLEYGIASSRIRYKGVGNSQPAIASPKNDGERMKNMRVQIIVLRK